MLPTPRYYIGQVVYAVQLTTMAHVYDCPDCLNSRFWIATSAAGEQHQISCPRCTAHYVGAPDSLPSLKYEKHVAGIRSLNIGSIRANTDDPAVEYMCKETGVGSGTLWKEGDLYPTPEEAEIIVNLKAAELNAIQAATPEATRARRFADKYTLAGAEKELRRQAIYTSWEAARNWQEQISIYFPRRDDKERYNQLDSRTREVSDEFWDEIDRYKKYEWTTMTHPIDDLIAAVQAFRNNASSDPAALVSLGGEMCVCLRKVEDLLE